MRSKTFIQTCMQSYDGLMKIPADTFFVSLKLNKYRQSLEICYFFLSKKLPIINNFSGLLLFGGSKENNWFTIIIIHV